MTKGKTQKILLLVLSVILLVLISSRVGISGRRALQKAADTPDDVSSVSSSESAAQEVEVTPTPTPEPYADKPDIAVYDWQYKLVDENSVLSSSFSPTVEAVQDGQYIDSRIVEDLNELIAAAKAQGYGVYISTAYRPYSTQAYLFFGKASQIAWGGEVEYADAEIKARKIIAYPGTSEHQLGLALDLMDSANTSMVAEDVKDMPLLVWLRENCADYGFILRYPEDKQDITGWFEPWHFRYVGVEAARYIMENDLCLEEFIDLY